MHVGVIHNSQAVPAILGKAGFISKPLSLQSKDNQPQEAAQKAQANI